MNILKIVFIVIFISQCNNRIAMDREEDPLYVMNNSDHSIKAYFNDNESYVALYPDTSIADFKSRLSVEISGGEKGLVIPGSEAPWESTFEVSVPSDTLSLFIFHADTLEKYPWEQIRSDYHILQRYDLSLPDLERIDFTVVYPPDSTMEGVQMYPGQR